MGWALRNRRRHCDACGGDELEQLWRRDALAATVNGLVRFDTIVRLCRRCGFVFASPAPAQQDLDRYYAESYATSGGDFSVETRAQLLERYRGAGRLLVEVGANATPEFGASARSIFGRMVVVEPNRACAADAASLDGIGGADVVASYFVLEHVREPVAFLHDCASALVAGGRVVCEVPDLRVYPEQPEPLLLHEHMSHFTPRSLEAVAARAGLRLIETASASRPFGFAAVLEPGDATVEPPEPEEVVEAREIALAAVDAASAALASLAELRARIAAERAPVVWVANSTMLMLGGVDGIPAHATIVDSDPRKRGYLPGREILLPQQVDLRSASLLVVCSSVHAEAIVAEAQSLADGSLPEVVVVR